MKKKVIIFTIVFLISEIGLAFCNSVDSELCECIKIAAKDITEIYIAPYELLYSESSQKVKDFFCGEEKKIISYLYCPDLSYEEKEILLWIVSKNVDLMLYAEFLVTLSEKNLKEKIEDELIQCCFFNWCLDCRVILNYKNEKIKQAIDTFLKTDISQEIEKELKELKNGKAAKRVKKNRILTKLGSLPQT